MAPVRVDASHFAAETTLPTRRLLARSAEAARYLSRLFSHLPGDGNPNTAAS
jgi:hypothetical protein